MIGKGWQDSSRAAVAVFVIFLANGALLGTWVSRIPAIQARLNLSEAELGMVLLGLSLGVLTALSLASHWIARFGSRRVTLAGFAFTGVVLPFLAWAPTASVLWILLFLFGGALSAMDVAMNEQAVFVERKAARPIMSTLHGAFSIGGLLGALLGAGMGALEVSALHHFVFAVVLFGGAVCAIASFLLQVTEARPITGAAFKMPERALWALGGIALASSVAEGAMADWSAVYLTEVLHTPDGYAALGFAAYSLAMTIGRLTGDRLVTRWSPAGLVRGGGLVAAVGLTIVVTSTLPIITLIGFATVGLGLANIIPIVFSAAGNHPEIPSGAGIASVATIGYAGFLAGPPLIGLVAEVTSLRIALALIVVLMLPLLWSAKRSGLVPHP